MSKIVVTGSIAYDHLMSFEGSFSDVIMPDQLKKLSVSFYAEDHQVMYGGCATNIAYSLKLLGGDPLIIGIAGNDFSRYEAWLNTNDIETEGIFIDLENPSPAAHILTDKEGAQITSFSPAAMKTYDGELRLRNLDTASLAIISPQLPSRMLQMAEYLIENDIDYIFDPGQALSAFRKEELLQLVAFAKGLIVNEYEADMFEKIIGEKLERLEGKLEFAVKTLGREGCEILHDGIWTKVAAYKVEKEVDPTGCGDGFRAGFLFGLSQKWDLVEACKLGNVIGSFVVEKVGTQRHHLEESELKQRLSSLSVD